VLEDAIADALEAPDDDDRAARMVALSVRMAADAAFFGASAAVECR